MAQMLSSLPSSVTSWLHRLRDALGDPARLMREGVKPRETLSWRARISVGAMLWFSELQRAEVPMRAAATAYAFVFALIPLFTTTIAFFTAFPGLGAERQRIESALFDNLLPGAAQSAQGYIEQFAERAAAAGAVSSLVFFVIVLTLFNTIEGTFNRIWKAERGRSWSERFVLLALFFVVGALAVTAMLVLSTQASALAERYQLESSAAGVFARQMGIALLNLLSSCALFIIANKVLPHAKVSWAAALIGGGIAGTLWHFLKDSFTWYVTNVASYENLYGTVAVLPVFFLWIYLTGMVLLASGALTFVVQNLRTMLAERRPTAAQAPRAWQAISALAVLARAFERQEAPLSAEELAGRLGVGQYVISESLKPLVAAGVVLAIAGSSKQHYALGVPARTVTLGRVVALTTGEDLTVPSEGPEPLRAHVARAFAQARRQEGNALERVSIAELVDDAPDAHPVAS